MSGRIVGSGWERCNTYREWSLANGKLIRAHQVGPLALARVPYTFYRHTLMAGLMHNHICLRIETSRTDSPLLSDP